MFKLWNRDELLRGLAETGGGTNGDKLTKLDEYLFRYSKQSLNRKYLRLITLFNCRYEVHKLNLAATIHTSGLNGSLEFEIAGF
jgi:hypothetical protein